jgi:hypothetical protein
MCALKQAGLEEEIKNLSDNPVVQCRHCGARANSLKYICAAHLGEDAPNVEGGHGNVGLDEVGKPHAGAKDGKEQEITVKEVPVDGVCGGY